MDNFIPVNVPLLNGNELKYVTDCIKTGWISSEGSYVRDFENALASKVGRKYGIALANGSAALDVAVATLKITKDDEVIMPANTIISCPLSVVRAGAKPVLVDNDIDTWNVDIDKIEEKITSKTKAIMAVHLYGLPTNMFKIQELANKYNLFVIEDAAQMMGQKINGMPCGSFGNISTTSFYPNKQITTGEGGMCFTDDEELAERCRSLRNLCFQAEKRFYHEELGFNYRMTNIQAAIGLAQVEELDNHVVRKREIGYKYLELLKDVKNIQLPLAKTDYAENIFWVFGLVLKKEAKNDATYYMKKLGEMGIGTRPFYYPIHKQPVFNKMGLFNEESYSVAEYLGDMGFYIPAGLGISDEEVERVSESLAKKLNYKG